jgi:putative colanic acid biosynthesis UDP-glucose lipid carrier transferase
MNDIQSLTLNKNSTSFHAVALNFIYIGLLALSHFLFPYIHELVYSFFNGLFLILSLLLFFYINALFRTSSITYFSYLSITLRLVLSIFMLAISIIFISFVTNTIEIIERSQFLNFLLSILFMQIVVMFLTKLIYSNFIPKKSHNIALITNVGDVRNNKIINFLSDDKFNIEKFNIGDIDDLIEYSIENRVEAVYIYIDSKNLNQLEDIFQKLCIFAFEIYWVLPDSIFIETYNPASIKPIRLNPSPVYLDTNQYLLKRSLDVIGSISILIILLPLIFLTAVGIKLTDFGPILYSQQRHGQHGKVFKMFKFRSMKVGSDSSNEQVSSNDERVTAIGYYIRKSSFDEIPQLINILRGEMSLVGPRPQTLLEIEIYSQKILRFLTRHHVKPGLTGLAQIRTRVKTDSVNLMQEKLKSDLEYINKWSFYLDIKILLNTPISMWKNRSTNT